MIEQSRPRPTVEGRRSFTSGVLTSPPTTTNVTFKAIANSASLAIPAAGTFTGKKSAKGRLPTLFSSLTSEADYHNYLLYSAFSALLGGSLPGVPVSGSGIDVDGPTQRPIGSRLRRGRLGEHF